jgi:hypothetical protein
VNERDSDGQTALHRAAAGGNLEAVKFLLEHNADVNAKGKTGVTALTLAKGFGRTEVVEFLTKFSNSNSPRPVPGGAASAIGKANTISPSIPLSAKGTEKSLIEYYKKMDQIFRKGTLEEKKKLARSLNITREDISKLFLKNTPRAWQVAQELNKELNEHVERMSSMFPDDEGDITRIETKPPGPEVESLRERGMLSASVPVYCLDVYRKESMSSSFEFYFVNGHWFLLPGMNRIFSR